MRRLPLVVLALSVSGCGDISPAPGGPDPQPSAVAPAPTSRHSVSGVLFYDENQNQQIDPGEDVRLPAVGVSVGGAAGVSASDGTFTVVQAPNGVQPVTLREDTLPPYFRLLVPPTVAVPVAPGGLVAVPAMLPTGTNHPNVYLGFGDSITNGDGSRGGRGYQDTLGSMLNRHWGGRAMVLNDGVQGNKSGQGLERIGASLAANRPAYVLILYGANDWNVFGCRRPETCETIPDARGMIRQARAAGTMPILGTVIPANPLRGSLPAERNAWADGINYYLRVMAQEEGVVVADMNAAFKRAAPTDQELARLFADHVHPNDGGYDVIAQEWFRAITTPQPGVRAAN